MKVATYTITPNPSSTVTPMVKNTITGTLHLTMTPTPTPTPTTLPTLGIGSTILREIDGMEMMYVPAGEFSTGSDHGDADEQPVHLVSLDGYWIDRFEVTFGQYVSCVEVKACTKPFFDRNSSRIDYYGDPVYANYPVIYVNQYQAKSYCRWAGGRLPTEAEWEKAARGTDGRTYPWGDDLATCNFLNYNPGVACIGDITAVGSYPAGASPYGLLDMAGNVSEWTADWYNENYYWKSPPKNPTGPESGKFAVVRGGGWLTNDYLQRTTYRNRAYSDASWEYWGFRCVVDP